MSTAINRTFPALRRRALRLGLAAAWVACASAQVDSAPETAAPVPPRGFRITRMYSNFDLYSTAASSSGTDAFSIGALGNRQAGLGHNQAAGGGFAGSWQRIRSRSSLVLNYEGDYQARLQYSGLNSWSHSLGLSATRQLSSRWDLAVFAGGSLLRSASLMFGNTGLSSVVSSPGFDGSVLNGNFDGAVQPSLITGTPVVDSPGRLLFYGSRLLTANAGFHLAYRPRPRLTLGFFSTGNRTQPIRSSEDNLNQAPLLSWTNILTSGASLSYSLSPRTQVGLEASFLRSASALLTSNSTTTVATFSRRMSPHWFVQARGGGGVIANPQIRPNAPSRLQYVAGGTLGYYRHPHTILLTCARTVGDTYGLGAGATQSLGLEWIWQRPGRAWFFNSSLSAQRLESLRSRNTEMMVFTFGAGRRLSRTFLLQTTYGYAMTSQLLGGLDSARVHGMRTAIIWMPGGSR